MSTSNQVNQRSTVSQKAISQKRNNARKRFGGCCGFRLPKRSELSPLKFLKRLSSKVAKALRLRRRPSPPVSSSGRSRPFITPIDSHRTEAIEDCIEFINSSSSASSSSFPRSNSITANPS